MQCTNNDLCDFHQQGRIFVARNIKSVYEIRFRVHSMPPGRVRFCAPTTANPLHTNPTDTDRCLQETGISFFYTYMPRHSTTFLYKTHLIYDGNSELLSSLNTSYFIFRFSRWLVEFCFFSVFISVPKDLVDTLPSGAFFSSFVMFFVACIIDCNAIYSHSNISEFVFVFEMMK